MPNHGSSWVLLHELVSSRDGEAALKEIRNELGEWGEVVVCFGDRGLAIKDDFEDTLGLDLRQVVARLRSAGTLEVKHLDERDAEIMGFVRSMAPPALLAELDRMQLR
ncbi:MAG: hypothetical protein HY433_00135 [Candidatus Liptonbacteria bacterium]|nr:hypothetical protein [Candidatus Liptonbacteria bacterium]